MAKEKETTETTEQTGSGNLLKDFTANDEWFGQKVEEGTETDKVIKEVKEEGTVVLDEDEGSGEEVEVKGKGKKGGGKKKDDEEEEESVFFGQGEKEKKEGKEEEDDDDDENKDEEDEEKDDKDKKEVKAKKEGKEKDEDDSKFYTVLAGEMKEKGIFQNVELEEGKDLTEEEFIELQDKEIEARVEETFQAFFNELDEDGKAFLQHKKNGGKTSDFLNVYADTLDIDEFDEKNPDHISKTLNYYLQVYEKLDGDDLKDRLEWLKEGGKEKTYATKYFNKINEDREEEKTKLAEAAKKANKKREDDTKAFNDDLSSVLAKTENVGVFSITKTDQKDLGNYITKPAVKVGTNRYVPQFQNDIAKIFRAETPEDKQKLILLAKLVKSNFDTTDVKTEVKTKVTKEIQTKLKDAKKGVKTASSGAGGSKKSLSDFFN